MKSLLYIAFILTLVAGCNAKVSDEADREIAKLSITTQIACDKGECPCDSPVGSVLHGSKITTYTESTAACDVGCGKFAEELTCNNGKFDKELTGLHFKCETSQCPACQLGDNLILSGDTVEVYSASEVGCRKSCEDIKQRRTCKMGKLTGSDDFKHFSCEPKTCRCSLPDNSGFVTLDGTIKLFSAQKAECGKRCETDYSLVRTCNAVTDSQGEETYSFNGSDAFRHRTCEEATNCFCTLPNNLGVLAHGQTRLLSTVPTVACGESCSSKPSITVRCENGAFKNNADLTKVVDFADPVFAPYRHVCQAEQCVSCLVPGTSLSKLHNEKHRFAKTLTVGCAETCQFMERTCKNGTFDGDISFNSPSCERRKCKCDVPNNPSVQIPVGGNYSFYNAAKAPCGNTCAGISAEKTCEEVKISETVYDYRFTGNPLFSFAQCEEATGCSCDLPGALGMIQDGKAIVLSSQQVVACGTSCDSIPSLGVKCSNGFLVRSDDSSLIDVAGTPYQYYCSQDACADCPLPGYGTIRNNSTLDLYSKNTLGCGEMPESITFRFKCENSLLTKNGTAFNAETETVKNWFNTYANNCPGCELPWGGSIAEGSSINAYKFFGTVVNECGRGCKVAQRKCDKGVLTGDPSFNMRACDNRCNAEGGGAPPRLCLLRWQNSYVTPDSQIPLWNRRSVKAPDTCLNHFKLARCKMETGTFDAPLDYIYQSCTEVP